MADLETVHSKCHGCGKVRRVHVREVNGRTVPQPYCPDCNVAVKKARRYGEALKIAKILAGGAEAYRQMPKWRRKELRSAAYTIVKSRQDANRLYAKIDRRFERGHPDGFVYIVTNPAFPGWFKVGMTTDPARRLASYQTACPERAFRMEHFRYFRDRSAAETRLMEKLQRRMHRNGEWFLGKKEIGFQALEDLPDN